MDKCIFCQIVEKKIPSEIVYETEEILAFRDVSPVAPVHVLVIPKIHVDSLQTLDATQRETLLPSIFGVIDHLVKTEGLSEEGFRVVNNTGTQGGQTVDHLHFHLLGGRSLQWPPG